jgi:hypothetical protein
MSRGHRHDVLPITPRATDMYGKRRKSLHVDDPDDKEPRRMTSALVRQLIRSLVLPVFLTIQELEEWLNKRFQCECPHCESIGRLWRNGKYYAKQASGEKILRGQRIICADCQHGFILRLAEFVSGHAVRCEEAGRFLECLAQADQPSIPQALERCEKPFSIATAYRWLKKLSLVQSVIRATLLSGHPCPPSPSRQRQPLLETYEHLRQVFGDRSCPLSAYQNRFQKSILANA